MKAKSVNCQIVINVGNYESIRIGGEWEIEYGETEESVLISVYETLRKTGALMVGMKATKQVGHPKPLLTKEHKRYPGVVRALCEGKATMEQVKQVFCLTDEMEREFLEKIKNSKL